VQSHDAIVIGAGVIGLSLARQLQLAGLKVLVIEKYEPCSESSYAAGGMIASCDPHIPDCLKPLVAASAQMYPEFVHEIELESDEATDLRGTGTIAWFEHDEEPGCESARRLNIDELKRIEPLLPSRPGAWFLPERSLDPRVLGRVLTKAAKHVGVDFVTGSAVAEILTATRAPQLPSPGNWGDVAAVHAAGVITSHATYHAGIVVNCAGAWAGQIRWGEPLLPSSGNLGKRSEIPTRPIKGQMVCLVPASDAPQRGPMIQHVVRTPDVYIIPRSDGRILLGATVEDAGFDKRVDPDTIQKLHHAGITAAPALALMRIHDAWAGLRPGTPDNLPIMGRTSLPGYFAATGHYRDGIMLAPITAHLMTQLIGGRIPDFDLAPFSAARFA
jgi:glycine oxidase